MKRCAFPILVAALSIAGALACSSSPDPAVPDYAGSCDALASRCHKSTTVLGVECHDLGHDGDDAKCGPRKGACFAECIAREEDDGGPDGAVAPEGDAGPLPDAGASADSPCATYCACMGATCGTQPSYPFASEAACLSACSAFDRPGLVCVVAACERAKSAPSASNKTHECEHGRSPTACH